MDSIPFNYDLNDSASLEADKTRFRTRSRARTRSRFLLRLLLGADILSAIVAGLITALVFSLSLGSFLILTLALAVFSVLLAAILGLYSDRDLLSWSSGLADAHRSVVAGLILSWMIFGLTELLGLGGSAAIAIVATALTASLASLTRALARGVAHRVTPLRQRTVMIGSGVVAERLAERLERHVEFGLETVGLVDDDVHTTEGTNQRLTKLGSLSELDAVLQEHQIDRVIIAFSRASHQELLSCIRTCRDHGVSVDVVPRLFELIDGAQGLSQIGGLPLLPVGAPRLASTSRIAKRGLDILVSATLLIVLSPVLLLIAILIKLTSRGPVLFNQIRVGRGGTTFKLYKFRSMYRDAEERKRQFDEDNEATDGVMFKIKRDPRITRIGGIIRRTSLDEIPQLYNVLKGDMSLVGPRPLILAESKHAEKSWHARRLDLRPGITGLWQVSGRSDVPFQEMVRFDYQYVSGWSLARDIEILFATIPVVLSGRGAY